MQQKATAFQLGAAAAVACCAVGTASVLYTYIIRYPEWYAKVQRYLSTHAPLHWTQFKGEEDEEPEDGEQPWPAEGFAGPLRCRPISTVSELLTWQPPLAADPCSCTTPLHLPPTQLQPTAFQAAVADAEDVSGALQAAAGVGAGGSIAAAGRPQLLVCHDMMGGYLEEEALLSGAADPSRYRIWHWDCIDVFVYFSHHMVTIPPKGWIHAAHKNSVKVLGTFITEFGLGRRRCRRLFKSHESARAVADQLVAIAAHYGFEGWLVNIENPLSPGQVAIMQHFVGYLRARTAEVCPHGMVVWYDAVTTAGKLDWQNGLTTLNAPFFDLADALFVNYTWTPSSLPATVAAAGSRSPDVFMGVDVHGRGSYGGGGFGAGLALSAAVKASLSAALFAPGWVYENLDKGQFHELQEQWWQQVQTSWGLSHPVVTRLPFSTCFNVGAGLAWFQLGAVAAAAQAAAAAAAACGNDAATVCGGAGGVQPTSSPAASSAPPAGWFDMLATDTVPCLRDPITQQVVSAGPVAGTLSCSTAFQGGSCLVLYQQPSVDPQQQQEQQQAEPQSSAVAAAADAAAVAGSKCSCPVVPQPVLSPSDGGSKDKRQVALLQLFTAHVAVPHDAVVTLKCTYAAARDPASSGGSSGSSSSSTAGTTSDHAHCSSSGSGYGALRTPRLWIMTKQTDQPPSSLQQGSVQQAGRGTETAAAKLHQTLHLPVGQVGSSSSVAPSGLGSGSSSSPLLLQDGQPSKVGLQWVVAADGERESSTAAATLGPVHLLSSSADGSDVQEGKVAAAGQPGNPASSSSSNTSSRAWMTALPSEMSSWRWMCVSYRVPIAAGSTITGLGVALPLLHGWDSSPFSDSGSTVLAVLGKVEASIS